MLRMLLASSRREKLEVLAGEIEAVEALEVLAGEIKAVEALSELPARDLWYTSLDWVDSGEGRD